MKHPIVIENDVINTATSDITYLLNLTLCNNIIGKTIQANKPHGNISAMTSNNKISLS